MVPAMAELPLRPPGRLSALWESETVGNIWIGEVLENGSLQGLKAIGINGLTGGSRTFIIFHIFKKGVDKLVSTYYNTIKLNAIK